MRQFRKSSTSYNPTYNGQHRFEHWYLDNAVYFITARCRGCYRAFADDKAKHIFRDRFDHYTSEHGFVPWATSLMDNHYHTLGYLKEGKQLGPMMQRIHGAVAKLVNDLLPERLSPFWFDSGKQGYFDGCIRDAVQARRAYGYILRQSTRHGFVTDWQMYPHTRVRVELERAIQRATELQAFLEAVGYRRYQKESGRMNPFSG